MNRNAFTHTLFVFACVLVAFCAGPQAAPAQVPGVQQAHMEIVTDEIVGVALYPDGITPIEDLPVRVWDVENQRMTYRTRTDSDGAFQIPQIDVGRSYIFVGRVKVDLRILSADVNTIHQHHDIVVIVPRGLIVSMRPHMMDVVLAPLLLPPPDEPKPVSP